MLRSSLSGRICVFQKSYIAPFPLSGVPQVKETGEAGFDTRGGSCAVDIDGVIIYLEYIAGFIAPPQH